MRLIQGHAASRRRWGCAARTPWTLDIGQSRCPVRQGSLISKTANWFVQFPPLFRCERGWSRVSPTGPKKRRSARPRGGGGKLRDGHFFDGVRSASRRRSIALCRTVVLRLRVALQSAVPPRRNVFALTRHPLGTRSRRNSGRYSKERARKVKALRFPARTAHCETRARKRLQGIPSPVARSLRHFSPSAEPLRPTRELGVIQIRLIPVIFQSFIRPGERCEGRGEAPAGEVWPHTLLCGRQGVLGNWNPGITGLAGMRTKPMEEAGRGEGKYKDASTQQGKGLPWKEKRRRACPNGIDPKLKTARFRLDEFISPPSGFLREENRASRATKSRGIILPVKCFCGYTNLLLCYSTFKDNSSL